MASMEIEVALCKEDRERLDALLSGLQQRVKLQYGIIGEAKAAGTPFKAPEPEQAPAETAPVETAPATEEIAPAPTAPATEEKQAPAKVYTLEEIRQVVMNLSRRGPEVKEKVKQALSKYATRVPDIPADKYSDFMADLEDIECPF